MATLEVGATLTERTYHQARARQEFHRAGAAASACARTAHLQLAALHAERCGSSCSPPFEANPRRWST